MLLAVGKDSARLLLVGDPCQAIFSGKDFKFSWWKELVYKATGTTIPDPIQLRTNFRTTGAIVRLGAFVQLVVDLLDLVVLIALAPLINSACPVLHFRILWIRLLRLAGPGLVGCLRRPPNRGHRAAFGLALGCALGRGAVHRILLILLIIIRF